VGGGSFGQHVHVKRGLWALVDQVGYGGANGTDFTSIGLRQGPRSAENLPNNSLQRKILSSPRFDADRSVPFQQQQACINASSLLPPLACWQTSNRQRNASQKSRRTRNERTRGRESRRLIFHFSATAATWRRNRDWNAEPATVRPTKDTLSKSSVVCWWEQVVILFLLRC